MSSAVFQTQLSDGVASGDRGSARRGFAGAELVRATLPFAAYLIAQAVQIAVLHRLVPRFFWLDDSQAQFGSMAWWLGNHLERGVPPLVDPGQGISGNVTADMQYGSFDPLHWLVMAVMGRAENVLTMAWLYGSACMIVLGLGVVALLRLHGVRPAWAVAGALGVASSGFFLWYGSFWWPLMWGSACLPWLWVGLSTRRPRGLLLTGLATWAVLASGNPYSLPFALMIALGQLVEYRRAAGSWEALVRSRVLWSQIGAMTAGLIIALPTLLNAVQMSGYTTRQSTETLIGNAGSAVPNFLDALVGGPTLLGQTNAFNGPIGLVPATTTFLLAVPLLALVKWRAAVNCPGVPTALVLTLSALAATQLPTTVGLFRFPFRYLVVVQIALPLLALLALAAAQAFTRRRITLAAGVVLVQFLLSTARAPALLPWHVLAALVTAGALTLLVVSARAVQRTTALAAAVGLVMAAGLPTVLGVREMVDVAQRLDSPDGTGDIGQPYRDIGIPGQSGSQALGQTVQEFRDRSILTDRTATVYAFGFFGNVFGVDRGWSKGFFPGNANLLAGATVGTGYVTSPHKYLGPILCTSYVGSVGCADNERLLSQVPGTSRRWIDVLSSDAVVLSATAPDDVRAWFEDQWQRTAGDDSWTTFERPVGDRLPGRIGALDGVRVADTGWRAGLARVGQAQESYLVTTGAQSGSIVLRVPFWPGYRATVDGVDVPVTAVDGALVRVQVPAAVTGGRLEIFFDPIGARLLFPALGAGVLMIFLVVMTGIVLERRDQPYAVRAEASKQPLPVVIR